MSGTVEPPIDTDLKTIQLYRNVHETVEHNPYIEEAERFAAEKAAAGRKSGKIKLESKRSTFNRVEKLKEAQAERFKEERKVFEKVQEKLLSTPSPLPLLLDEVDDFQEKPIQQQEEQQQTVFDKEAWIRRVDEDLEESFKIFDINGDGMISLYELQAVMQSVGKDISSQDAQDILEFIDVNGDGGITYAEFKELMYDKMYEGTMDEDLEGCFKIFDMDGDGYISPLEIQALFKKLGELITTDEAVEIMADCDLNQDGLIDFDEFKAFYEKINKQLMEEAANKNKLEKLEEMGELPIGNVASGNVASPSVYK